jgi:phosphotransferase system  glucose/maltose/N-acetylglucosamine-specific IIC component
LLMFGFSFLTLFFKIHFFKRPSLFIFIMLLMLSMHLIENLGLIDFLSYLSLQLFNGLINGSFYLILIPISIISGVLYMLFYMVRSSFYMETS